MIKYIIQWLRKVYISNYNSNYKMDYYKLRKMAFITIDKLLSLGKSDAEIIYKLSMLYGLDEKILEKRKKQIKNLQEDLKNGSD